MLNQYIGRRIEEVLAEIEAIHDGPTRVIYIRLPDDAEWPANDDYVEDRLNIVVDENGLITDYSPVG
jgi:hypothetical protein